MALPLGYALFHREPSGRGQYIDLSIIDALYHMHAANRELRANANTELHPIRCRAHHQGLAPDGVFKGVEGWIAILAGDLQWPGFPRAMGQPELSDDPRFADMRSRARHSRELVELVEAWMARRLPAAARPRPGLARSRYCSGRCLACCCFPLPAP